MAHDTEPRLGSVFGALFAACIVFGFAAAPAAAQSNECERLAKNFQNRMKTIQEIENFQKRRPTADKACGAFTRLQEQTASVVAEIERNGAWCHVPPDVLPGLQQQQAQIVDARQNACGAAQQQRKAAEEAKRQGLLGGGDIIGGPMRIPQGAL